MPHHTSARKAASLGGLKCVQPAEWQSGFIPGEKGPEKNHSRSYNLVLEQAVLRSKYTPASVLPIYVHRRVGFPFLFMPVQML